MSTAIRAVVLLVVFSASIALPFDRHPCVRPFELLAAREARTYQGQHVTTHFLTEDRAVEEYRATSNDPADLHPRIVQGLLTANDRFVQTRGDEIAPDHVFQKQKSVDAANTRYFVLAEPGQRDEARGLGMLVDGTRGARLPVEKELAERGIVFDMRFRRERPIEVMEIARLGIAAEERGGLRLVFQGMADHLALKYDGPRGVPRDLYLVLWTSQQMLAERYHEAYGFREWFNPDKGHWVMGMRATEFMRRYYLNSDIIEGP